MYNSALISRFADQIVYLARPVEIILFGSYASGKQRNNSDIDLLIVIDALVNRQQLAREITGFIHEFGCHADIIIINENELELEMTIKKSFLFNALKTSIKIYEKKVRNI